MYNIFCLWEDNLEQFHVTVLNHLNHLVLYWVFWWDEWWVEWDICWLAYSQHWHVLSTLGFELRLPDFLPHISDHYTTEPQPNLLRLMFFLFVNSTFFVTKSMSVATFQGNCQCLTFLSIYPYRKVKLKITEIGQFFVWIVWILLTFSEWINIYCITTIICYA